MKYFTLIFALSILISCKSKKEIVETSTPTTEYTRQAMTDFMVSLREGPCFGTCPVFNIDVDQYGLAIYKGGNFSDRLGTYSKQLTELQMNRLNEAFQACKIFELKGNYISNIPDMQMYTITATQGRRPTKVIMFKENRPDELAHLRQVLHDIATDETGWTLEEPADVDEDIPEEEKADALVNKDELIIELESTTKVSRWFRANKDVYGLYLIKKISPNSNYWLYTYDTKQFSPEEIMDKLNADPEVKNVEFNTSIENR